MITATVEQLYQQHIKALPLAEQWQLVNLIKNETLPPALRIEPGRRGLALLRRAETYQALAETVLANPFMVEPEFMTALEQATTISRPYRQMLIERRDWLRQLAKRWQQLGMKSKITQRIEPSLANYKKQLTEYEAKLKQFEAQYGMSSAEFYQKFEAGELGDAMDFFDWSGLVEFQKYTQDKIGKLETTR